MEVLYLQQYYSTNASGGGTRHYEFTRYLSQNGVNVKVITGRALDEDCQSTPELTVFTTATRYSGMMKPWRRILAFIDYSAKALIKGLQLKNFNLIFASSTPLTIGLPAVLLSKLTSKKLIFEVRDVWPDIPIAMGYIRSPLLKWVLRWFEMWIYRNSAHIIVLSTGMYRNLINKGVPPEKLTVIENLANLHLYDNAEGNARDQHLSGKFVCIHPGAMGHVNGLDFILDVAKNVIHIDDEIVFLLIGEGREKQHLLNRVRDENLTNVIIRDSVPKCEIVELIKSSDVGIMCVDNRYKILEDNSANKFFDYLAAGLPVIINYQGWQKGVIEEHGCGKSDLEPSEMARTILEIKRHPDTARIMARNSRLLAERQFSDIIAKQKLIGVIARVSGRAEGSH